MAGGPYLALGPITFQCRKGAPYPRPKFIRKVKGWTKSFFYSKSCSPPLEVAFLPFTLTPFEPNNRLTSRAGPADSATAKALSQKVAVLVRRGLRFRNLVAGWINHWIQPLSLRPRLLCTYSGDTGDSLHGYKAPWDQGSQDRDSVSDRHLSCKITNCRIITSRIVKSWILLMES
jgi:hypothetical protein